MFCFSIYFLYPSPLIVFPPRRSLWIIPSLSLSLLYLYLSLPLSIPLSLSLPPLISLCPFFLLVLPLSLFRFLRFGSYPFFLLRRNPPPPFSLDVSLLALIPSFSFSSLSPFPSYFPTLPPLIPPLFFSRTSLLSHLTLPTSPSPSPPPPPPFTPSQVALQASLRRPASLSAATRSFSAKTDEIFAPKDTVSRYFVLLILMSSFRYVKNALLSDAWRSVIRILVILCICLMQGTWYLRHSSYNTAVVKGLR